MALWGNKDGKPASGQVVINSLGYVEGNNTHFTTEARIGDTMIVGNNQYVIVNIGNDGEATVTAAKHGAEIAEVNSWANYALSEKPVYVSQAESADTSGDSGDVSKVFGVDKYEIAEGAGMVTDIAIVQGGSNYTEVPGVFIQVGAEGQASAEATIAGGVVTAITVTNGGGFGYNAVPQVNIEVPRRTIPTANVNTTTETITYTGHGLTTAASVLYYANGGTALVGFADGSQHFVHVVNADSFTLYDSPAHATAGGATGKRNLTNTGNDNQYFDVEAPVAVTATAKAVLGSGTEGEVWNGYSNWVHGEQHVTHAGWVRKTVGTGGRAGRVQYETLVAMGSMQGDAPDDRAFPED